MAEPLPPSHSDSTPAKLPPLESLPIQQQDFIAHYLKTQNCTQAAITAGYSKKSAHSMGSQLLKRLKGFIDREAEKRLRPKLHAAEVIVDRLQTIADASIDQFMGWDPDRHEIKLKKVEDIPKELRRCIKSITQHETQHAKYLKLELHSPVSALGMLAKYHNLFKRTMASKGLVVVIQRPPVKVEIKAPIDVTPKPNGNGHGHAKPPQVTFIRPAAGKTTATIAPGTTNGNGRGH